MDFDLYNSELYLAHNAPVRLVSAQGVRIVCTAGRVWLTVAGEAGDVLLAAGESHLVRGRGLALLEAIGDGRVRFEAAAKPWQRLLLAPLHAIWQRRQGSLLLDRRPAQPLPLCTRQVGA